MTGSIGRRPLPRSLVPLPDESLSGYVLRLAYRLDCSPGRIAELTTLGNYRQDRVVALPAHLLVGLRSPAAANFAAAARLTAAEVAGLGLRRYSEVYPPLAGAGAQENGRVLYNAWAFTASSRFCPQCLGGDGDLVQQAHGGAWRQQWHLPTTFACVRHERLLDYLCPHCRRPPSGRLGAKTSLLLHLHCEALHPKQCRNHALDAPLQRPRLLCGADLTGEARSAAPVLDAEVLARCVALQARIQQRLCLSPKDQSDPAYFHDLIAVAQLIIMSWPVPMRMASTPSPMVEALDAHIQDVRRKAAALPKGRPRELLAPPTHPAASAALLLQADELLADREPARLREVMPPLAEVASAQELGRFGKLVNHQPMTDQLRLAMGLQHLGFRVGSRLGAVATQPVSLPSVWIRESQVPQLIPLEWYHRHLQPFTKTLTSVKRDTVRHVRRAGALMLAQLASGNSVKECAEVLKIPPGRAHTSIKVLRCRANSKGWQLLQAGVRAIAHEIERAQDPPNYAQRRQVLAQWDIPGDDWEQLTHGMSPRMRDPWRHKVSTIIVWTYVTEGDYLLSPLVRDEELGNHLAQGKSISKGVAAHLAARTGERPILRARLGRYAERIAQWCNEQHVTSGTK
ncbi:TniQ family protein [Streptomyces sp. NPDC013978]|uniref:TniQ family protein n=1 Tax=Streptomyces sp. NPDC013978 TaxID=3364869 RepID=UPI0036FC7E7B